MVHRQQLDRLISTNLPAVSLWGLVVFVSIATARRCYCGRQFAIVWGVLPENSEVAIILFAYISFRARVHVGKGSSSKKQGDDTPCKVQADDTGRTGWYGRSHLAHA